jgi:two-component system, NtrC family, nitrogen regulation sensor histidine kinase NtrY
MGLRFRIFLGMMAVVICALMATGFVAYRHGVDAEATYNAQRLLRKEAALQRSLSYMLKRMGGSVSQDSLALVFTDRICELADVHSLTFSLYNNRGGLVTTSAGPGSPDTTVALNLTPAVLASAVGGEGRSEIPNIRGGTDVVWPLRSSAGEVLALGHVHYDPREAEEADWRAFLLRLAPVYLLLFVLVGILAFWLSNSIVGPLRRLSSDMLSNPLKRQAARSLEYRWKDEIGTLVQSYNELLKQLEESMNARASLEREGAWREMAQQVAHEIKNPLTPLKLGAQHLNRAWEDGALDFEERLKRYTQTTVQQIDALSQIAEGFALLATDGKAAPVYLDLRHLLQDVAYLHESEGVRIEVPEGSVTVLADRTRLMRAFNNLVRNALESNGGKAVSVQVRLDVSTPGWARVQVEDNGAGIEAGRLERIFEPKFTTKTHGLGLGLAMVKAIVKGAKGKISVESSPGSGSVFTVLLPLQTRE